jgi:hypothetical protein
MGEIVGDQMSEFEQKLLAYMESIERTLERIALAMESSKPDSGEAPNLQATLEEFSTYDWAAIGAEPEKQDAFGVATVLWRGRRFVRRSPENAYGATIYFSRSVGKDEKGVNRYERLITFKPESEIKVRPISREAEGYLR